MKKLKIGLLALVANLAAQATLAAQETRPDGTGDAVSILTQLHGHRPQAELDAFADSLVAVAIEHERSGSRHPNRASFAWVWSARPEEDGAVPYAGAYDALARVFAATRSWSALTFMVQVDSRRAKPHVLELVVAEDRDVACPANHILRDDIEGGEELLRDLTNSGALVHDCLARSHGTIFTMLDPIEAQIPPSFGNILELLQMGDAVAAKQAVDILTQVGEWQHPYEVYWLADSLVVLASLGDGEGTVAVRAREVLEQAARPTHPDAVPHHDRWDVFVRVFEATGSQAALESLAGIDLDRAVPFLSDVASRDDPASCKAQAVLATVDGGLRQLRALEEASALAYRCPDEQR